VAAARRRRARGKRGRGQGRQGAEVGEVKGDAWERNAAGAGAREAVPAVERRRQTQSRGGSGVVRGRRSRGCQKD
jgi:hypothetical protein